MVCKGQREKKPLICNFFYLLFPPRVNKKIELIPPQPIITVQKMSDDEEGVSMIDENKTRPDFQNKGDGFYVLVTLQSVESEILIGVLY